MKEYNIASIPGDGIGKEVVPEGLKVLKDAAERHQFKINFTEYDFASCDYYEKHGKMPSKVGIFFLRHKLKMINVDEDLLKLARRELELIHGHTGLTSEMIDYPRTITGLCKWSTGQCDFYNTCKPHNRN